MDSGLEPPHHNDLRVPRHADGCCYIDCLSITPHPPFTIPHTLIVY